MSTLRVSTIEDTAGSNSSTPAAIANGIAKAWVNFNGTGTVAIRAQYNVSSITDNGVGDYTVNFTTALADANIVVNATALNNVGIGFPTVGLETAPTASNSGRITTVYKTGATSGSYSSFDPASVFVSIFR